MRIDINLKLTMSSSDENDADHEESDEFDYPQIVTGIHIPHLSIDTICHACNNTVRTGNYVVACKMFHRPVTQLYAAC